MKRVVVNPVSKELVISQFKEVLSFPSYCTYNLDSFEECLLDYLEENSIELEILHIGPLTLPENDARAYLSILRDASEDHVLTVSEL